MISRHTGLGLAVAALAVAAGAARAENAKARPVNEAKELFRQIRGGEPAPKRCGLSAVWLSYPIPEFIARPHLGLNLHADVSSSYAPASVKEVLDPNGENAEAYCDQATLEKYADERLKDFEKTTENSLSVGVVSYSFPVFDLSYRKAVVIVESFGEGWGRRGSEVLRNEPFMSIYAVIYAKVKGAWRLIATEQLGIT